MSTSKPHNVPTSSGFSRALIGFGIFLVLGITGIVGIAHGARWMGLTHFGGIIHGAKIQLTSWSLSTPGIKIVSEIENNRGNDRYEIGGVMAWVYAEGQEEPVATYLSRDGLGGGGERCTIGLWPKSVVPNATTRLLGVQSVSIRVEEVEMSEAGGLVPIKLLGEFVVPVSR